MLDKISNKRCGVILVVLLLLGFGRQAIAAANATITVNGAEQQISGGWDHGNIAVAFNGFIETVSYAQFSSPASIASALAAMFSRDYIQYGLCANASGSTITFHLKGTATFGPLDISGPTSSFQLSSSGWSSQVSVADTGTISLTVNGVVASATRYSEGATPTSVAAGLAAGATSASPVNITAVNDAIYLEAKQAGAGTNYSYSLAPTSYDSQDFSQPSFMSPALSGNLEGGADQNASGSTVYSYSESYYPNSDLNSITDSVMGTWTFSYDNLNRLALATDNQRNNQYSNYCWSYDSFGNRTNQEGSNAAFQSSSGGQSCQPASGATAGETWANYNSNNQVTATLQASAVGYDAAGDITNDGLNQYLYDAEGRICAVANTPIPGITVMTGYLYNAEGQRVAKGSITSWSCDPGANGFTTSNDYILGPSGEQLTEMAMSENGSMAWQHTNVYANGQLLATYDDNGLHFHLSDALGTRRAQTDYAGVLEQTCSGLPFGDSLACTGSVQSPTEHHFTGKERDTESGNDYFGARYYGSSMGRWMSPDPIKLTDERLLDPANTLNQYSYAANNPLKFVDPDGQDVTYLYDQGGIAGHAVLFAYNQQTGDSAIESFGPVVHAPIAPGESMFDMSSLHSADDVRSTYASLTIQTSPELAQQVIAYIRANPDPSTWTAVGPNCSTQCIKILQKFKLANQKDSGLRPKLLWNTLRRQYNPNAPANPKNGTDYGNPRTDMFNALWLSLPQAPKDNSSVTVTVTNCVTDSNGQHHCDTQ